MSYEPTTWKAGDKVTSAKLNKIEQGIANNTFIVHGSYLWNEDENDYILTITENVADIFAALENNITVILNMIERYGHTLFYIHNYTFPEDNYEGFLMFTTIAYLESVSQDQTNIYQQIVTWDEGWQYKEFNKILNFTPVD